MTTAFTDHDPQPIETAPRDGTTILVFHGPRQVSALAAWNSRSQAWISKRPPVAGLCLSDVRWWHTVRE